MFRAVRSLFDAECSAPKTILHLPTAILIFPLLLLTGGFSSTFATVRYVDVNSASPTAPYTNWATAAAVIQDAVDAAETGDEIVVTNGIYATGGRAVYGTMTNRVAVDKALTVRSVNGPQLTAIKGYQVPGTTNGDGAIRCVYLTNDASLAGFTLTNGATRKTGDVAQEQSGGGAYSGTLTNCVLTGNSAYICGGGVYDGRLDNCTLSGNSAWEGGGAYNGTLNNCTVSGNSAGTDGGGVYCGTLNNCTLSGNSAVYGNGGGAAGDQSTEIFCTLNHCTLCNNTAGGTGGGAYYCLLSNCTLTANSAADGGGAQFSTLTACMLSNNSALIPAWGSGGFGGGGCDSTLINCTITANSAEDSGGGAWLCTVGNCTLSGNSAEIGGGGASGCTLANCVLSGNSAAWGGGAASYYDSSGGYFYPSTLTNCTLSGNTATAHGGAADSTLNNCVVYYNSAPTDANYDGGSTLNYCCTAPLPSSGVGNLTAEPQLTDSAHVSATSPCRGAGSAAYTNSVDIDGEAWASPPSIGCDEFYAGVTTGLLTVAVWANYTNVAVGFAVTFPAQILGHASSNGWDFGDGAVASNQVGATHAWGAPGDYPVVLRAYNDSNPGGVSATVTVQVVEGLYYVAADNPNPVPPYTSWATAATNIQDAVDMAAAGGQVVVTNGTYQYGGRAVSGTMTNRVAVTKPVTLCSVNGPQFAAIKGYQVAGTTNGDGAIRCVYLALGARLQGFTLTRGATRIAGDQNLERSGGGLWCEAGAVASNCVLTGNAASYYGGGACHGTLINCTLSDNVVYGQLGAGGGAGGGELENCILSSNTAWNGGGASQSGLNNCILSGNMAARNGGGAHYSTLNNCTLGGNSAAYYGGGARYGTLNNCIVYYNTAPNGENYSAGDFNYGCTTPQPTNGVGNITNAPLFVNLAGGNLRLQTNSPCINAGNNAYGVGTTDLDGRPRIVGSTVDMGAYEFQGPGMGEFIGWLQQFGLATDGSSDYADSDADGHNNWQEWRCLTDPTNALSVLRLVSAAPVGPDVSVTWQSVAGVDYFLECSTNLAALPGFTCVATNLPGQSGMTSYTDTNAASPTPRFYRVGVGN